MKDTVVVGFGHKSRSGKDEAVRAIIEARAGQYDVRRYAFGDALKEEVNYESSVCGYNMLEFFKLLTEGHTLSDGTFAKIPDWVQYDPDAPMDEPHCPFGKQRALLQWWGTEFRRNQDPNYWVDKLEATLLVEQPRIALISDVRFPNEVSWVKSDPSSGFVCRVDRLGYKRDGSQHPSETILDFLGDEDWHFILQVPDGELEELRRDAVVVFDLIVQALTPPDLSEFEKFEQKVIPASEVVEQ